MKVQFERELKKLLSKSPSEWKSEAKLESEISKFHLDDASASQSSLYMKWAGLAETARMYCDVVENKLKDKEAKLDLKIRNDPASYGLALDRDGNAKETAIKSVVRRDKEVRKTRDKLVQARSYFKSLERAVESFEQRKTMIRLLGDLWLGEYYSMVNIKDDYQASLGSRIVKAAKLSKKMKRKKR